MVNSICIKTNNTNIINTLLNNLENIKLNDVYLSQNDFKNYSNVIVHYRGNSIDLFYSKIADILADIITNYYEKTIVKRIINSNYFYFNDIEKKKIFDICSETLLDTENLEFSSRKNIVFISFLKYIIYNKALVLDGFINFRLKDNISILDEAVDYSVNKFLIEREYAEFVNLLKVYIDSKKSNTSMIHLIYTKQESILVDEYHNLINTDEHVFEAKYLSDITFSSNDYALNTLLTLLPQKINIHLIDSKEDEFINTLKLIFDNRVYLVNQRFNFISNRVHISVTANMDIVIFICPFEDSFIRRHRSNRSAQLRCYLIRRKR